MPIMRLAASVVRGRLSVLVLLMTALLFCFFHSTSWEMTRVKVRNPRSDALIRSNALRQHLQDVCQDPSLSSNRSYETLRHMHYDDKRKVIYCFIPKVACTSWKRVWMKMTGKIKQHINETAVNRYKVHTSLPVLDFDKNKMEKLRTYKKFMLVRHPFERVLSAYRDKLENEDKQSVYNFHKKIGKKIEMKYRGTAEREGHNVTFSEFMRFISEPGHGTPEQRNEHWLPMHELCSPCSVQYDFIGKYENLKEDANYLLEWLDATDLVDEFPTSDRPFRSSRYVSKYYEQLTDSEIKAFHIKYMPDYRLFNYKFI